MKKLTPEEFAKLPLHGRGSSSPFFNAILSLKVEENIIIEKKEWNKKYTPMKLVSRIERKFGMKYVRGALPDRSGWGIKRVK
jgi:hypothetical protein